MPVRIVEWQLPYTWGTGIEIDGNKVISLLLREENNLIMVNDNNEVYTDLQLESGLTPSSDFPVWVTVWKVLQADWWTKSGLVLNRKTTSGDYARWIYATDWEIYFDNWTGAWKQVYYSSEVDALFTQLRSELATVAFTWDYDDLINKPVDDTMYWSSWDWKTEKAPSQNAVYDKINSIDSLISTNATPTNKLMDKNYIDDGINSVTAYYITKNAQGDQFATHAELASATTFYSWWVVRVPTRNDYTIVLDDETHNDEVTRYIYNNGWEYQYTINESPMTQAQLNALNSWITSAKVSQYDGYATSKANDSEVVKLSGNQTIAWTKTFSTSPVVPSKTTAATNSWTKIATEAQVYKKQDTLVSWTNIKTINSNSLLGSWNLTLNDVKVSATAPSSPTEWMVWYDTTNDQLKVYDWSQWNVTGKEYNAWPWIEIKNWLDYSAMQWPCPTWFHIPSENEWTAVKTVWTTLWGWDTDWTNFWIALKLPFAGARWYTSSNVYDQGTTGLYWSSTRYNSNNSRRLLMSNSSLNTNQSNILSSCFSLRWLKDSPVVPTSSWTKLYWTSIEAGWIFWSSTDWLISMSSNWTTWITIADKNVWATTVWNSWDTLSEANCGKYFQRWNNYWFPRTWTITDTSTTQIDASTYWPWNYYSSSTFIIYNWSWDSSDNYNLRWWTTWVVTIQNVISNTGVLSVNGQTGDVTVASPDMSNYLAKDNTTAFTPSWNYNPATKKYVDDSIGGLSQIKVHLVSYPFSIWDDWSAIWNDLDGGWYSVVLADGSNRTWLVTFWNTSPSNTVTVVSWEITYKVTLDNNYEISDITNAGYLSPNPIKVVASLPANPDANTIYIVQ